MMYRHTSVSRVRVQFRVIMPCLVSPWWHASTGSAGCHAEAGRLGHGLCKAPPPRRLEQPLLGQPLLEQQLLEQHILEKLRRQGVAVVSRPTPSLCLFVVVHHHSPSGWSRVLWCSGLQNVSRKVKVSLATWLHTTPAHGQESAAHCRSVGIARVRPAAAHRV